MNRTGRKRGLRYLWILAAVVIPLAGFVRAEKLHGFVRDDDIDAMRNQYAQAHIGLIAEELKDYKAKHGAYPTMEQGLLALDSLAARTKNQDPATYEYAYLRATPSGFLSVWGEPYIYENRNGLPPSAFANSGVGQGSGLFTCKVDEGIYVWCLGGKRNLKSDWIWLPPVGVAMLLSSVCILMFVHTGKRAGRPERAESEEENLPRWPVLRWFLIVAAAVFVLKPLTIPIGCGEMLVPSLRDRQLTDDYIAVMRKYRDQGAISTAAFQKFTEPLARDLDSVDYYRTE